MMARVAAWRAGAGMAALFALALLPGCSAPAREGQAPQGRPVRIVSMNPCVDAILREVADPAQIAAISHYSHDPRAASVPEAWARRYAAVGDAAEDVLAARPDLVIAGPHIAPETLAALRRMGVPMLSTTVPATLAESAAQITAIATRIDQPEKGRALNQRIAGAVARAKADAYADADADADADARHGPRALIWQDGGLVPGPGTLADEMLRIAGFRSAAGQMGLAQWDMISVEQILLSPPDIVMTGAVGMESDGSGQGVARHPVLRQAGAHILFADFPSRLLHCAGPTIIDTAERLSAIRARWLREHKA